VNREEAWPGSRKGVITYPKDKTGKKTKNKRREPQKIIVLYPNLFYLLFKDQALHK